LRRNSREEHSTSKYASHPRGEEGEGGRSPPLFLLEEEREKKESLPVLYPCKEAAEGKMKKKKEKGCFPNGYKKEGKDGRGPTHRRSNFPPSEKKGEEKEFLRCLKKKKNFCSTPNHERKKGKEMGLKRITLTRHLRRKRRGKTNSLFAATGKNKKKGKKRLPSRLPP